MTPEQDIVEQLLAGIGSYGDDGIVGTRAGLIREAAATITALRAERDEALDAEYATKDLFWVVYPKYLEMGGKPVPLTTAGTDWKARADAAEAELSTLREQLQEVRSALGFYAEKDNYEKQLVTEDCGCCSYWHDAKIGSEGDTGERARTALSTSNGGGDGK